MYLAVWGRVVLLVGVVVGLFTFMGRGELRGY